MVHQECRLAALLIGAELGKGVASMVYQLSPSATSTALRTPSRFRRLEGMIQKEDCAGNDLDYMKGIVKEITVMQKLPKAILRGHWRGNRQ